MITRADLVVLSSDADALPASNNLPNQGEKYENRPIWYHNVGSVILCIFYFEAASYIQKWTGGVVSFAGNAQDALVTDITAQFPAPIL
jgi:hypothetical protein